MLIQMAGHPGAGKSTLARRLGARLGATVLDLDVLKSALLDLGLGWEQAAQGAYAGLHALADDLVSVEGGRVIVDTPSYWAEIHERLTAIADAHGAAYAFVECEADEGIRAERLAARPRHRSQVRGPDANPIDAPAGMGVVHHRAIERPVGRTCTIVRTDGDVEVDLVLRAIGLDAAR